MKIHISSQELEILRKSAEGMTVQQIASELNLNPKEVSKSQKMILSRTSCANVMSALQELARKGFELKDELRILKN
jgi:DNA-binding NarL/FixJ family response regulator